MKNMAFYNRLKLIFETYTKFEEAKANVEKRNFIQKLFSRDELQDYDLKLMYINCFNEDFFDEYHEEENITYVHEAARLFVIFYNHFPIKEVLPGFEKILRHEILPNEMRRLATKMRDIAKIKVEYVNLSNRFRK